MADCADAKKEGEGRGDDALAAPPALLDAIAKTLDGWLRRSLADEGLLRSLAASLRPHLPTEGATPARARGQHATAEDLAAVVEALLLLEGRVARLEESLRSPAAPPSPKRRGSGKAGKSRGKKGGAGR